MSSRTVMDGNAFYEIDKECMAQKIRDAGRRTGQGRQADANRQTEAARQRGTSEYSGKPGNPAGEGSCGMI